MNPVDPRRLRRLALGPGARCRRASIGTSRWTRRRAVNLIPAWYWSEGKPYCRRRRLLVRRPCRRRGMAEAAARVRQARVPATIQPMPYVAIQSKDDASAPHGIRSYAKNGFLGSLTNDGIDLIMDVSGAHARPVRHLLRPLRRGVLAHGPGCDGVPAARHAVRACHLERLADVGRRRRESGERCAPPGASSSRSRRVSTPTTPAATIVVAGQRENFGPNFERLVALKAKYDPMNLFRLNANVPPKA